MIENENTESALDADNTLANEELAEVKGGIALSAALTRASVASLAKVSRLSLAGLRARLGVNADDVAFVNDSGPTWVDSPRSFGLGELVSIRQR
jgi:hypothetical protein